jgi:carbamate kinase
LGNLLPIEKPIASILTMVEIDPEDPAFSNPTKPIGPVYSEKDAKQLAENKGWDIKRDGEYWRRVVPSPEPHRIFELRPIHWLLEKGTVVICAGGGGIPTSYVEKGKLEGVEVVIDKDKASSLLAFELDADLLIMATDTDGVYIDWGSDSQEIISKTTPEKISQYTFDRGSMGPKVEAACTFVERTGQRAVIGSLNDIKKMVNSLAGTQFTLK